MTYTVRQILPLTGEITSRHEGRADAAYAYALAIRQANYAEILHDHTGRCVASYVRGLGSTWHGEHDAGKAGAS